MIILVVFSLNDSMTVDFSVALAWFAPGATKNRMAGWVENLSGHQVGVDQ